MHFCRILKKTAASLPFFFVLISVVVFAEPFVILSGNWQQGAVIRGKAQVDVELMFSGRKLSQTNDGEFVIGLGREEPEDVVLTSTQNGKKLEHHFTVKQRSYDTQSVTGVPQATVEPNPEQEARIKAEAVRVSEARKVDLLINEFTREFSWPVLGPISGVYGSQRIYNGVPKTPHNGVDIAMPVGTEVYAPAGGTVTLAEPDLFLSGGTLILDHGHGLSSTFLHLSRLSVKQGQVVNQGDLIGLVGKTGRASGPHLHWAMNWFEVRVDPQLIVPEMPTTSKKN